MLYCRRVSDRTKALLAIITASLLWSTAGIAKPLVRLFDPFTVAFFRFFIASFVILPFFLREQASKKTSLLPLIPLALTSTANITLFYIGLTTSTANAAVIIYSATPLLVAITAPTVIKEYVGVKKLVGIALGLVGALFVTVLPILEGTVPISGDIRGNLFFTAAAVSWAIYTLGSRHAIAARGYSPLVLSATSIFTSAVVFGLLTPLFWHIHYASLLGNTSNITLLLHLGILTTVATYLLFQWAIKHSSATTVSLNQYLQPVFAILFHVVFLGEVLTTQFVLGSLLVIVGVFIATGGNVIREVRSWGRRK